MELFTTTQQFDSLHSVADTRRVVVKVAREALLHLLMDHSAMVRALREKGVKVTEPVPHRVRPKIKPMEG